MVLLGKKIKSLRKKSNYTQAELARQIGVAKSTIAAYENDSRQPSYDVLIKLADIFNVTTDNILLNGKETVLNVHDLTPEQQNIINALISQFKATNKCSYDLYQKNRME